MPTNGDAEYEIIIQHDGYLTRLDLDEVLTAIDRIIELTAFDYPLRWDDRDRYPWRGPAFPPSWPADSPALSYVGIKSIRPGSIGLEVVIGGAIAVYVAKRFKRGVDASLLAEELERSGRLTGEVIGRALERVNDWAETYVRKQREFGGKITAIETRRRNERGRQ